MREDVHDDKTDVIPRHALMQTYVDDPVTDQGQTFPLPVDPASADQASSDTGTGMPQVV